MDKARVLKAAYSSLGAREKDPAADRLLEKVYDENVSVFSPRSVCEMFPVLISEECVFLEGSECFLRGESIRKHLFGAKYAILQAFTLGLATDKRIKELSFARPSEGIALNAIASVVAELEADAALKREAEALSEAFCNFRFCPGYGDLPLDANASLARALNAAKKIGLSVADGGLLLPRKSIIGVAGVFEKERGK